MDEAARNEWALIAAVFICFVGSFLVLPFVPLYVQEMGRLDAAETALWSGLILGATPLVVGIVAPLWGSFADRYGRRIMLQGSLLIFVACYTAMGVATEPWHLLVIRSVEGVVGGFTVSVSALASSNTTPARLSISIGRIHAARVLGMAAGPIPGGFLADHVGFRFPYFAAAGLVLGALLIVTLLTTAEGKRPLVAAAAQVPALRSVLLSVPFLGIAFAILATRLAERSFEPVLPLLVAATGVARPGVATAAITAAGLLASSIGAVAIGYIANDTNRNRVLVAILVLTALLFLPAPAFTSFEMLLALRAAAGLLLGASLTLAVSSAAATAPIERRSGALGFVACASSGGSALGYFLAGALSPFGLAFVFTLDAVIVMAAALFLLRPTQLRHGRAGGRRAYACDRAKRGGGGRITSSNKHFCSTSNGGTMRRRRPGRHQEASTPWRPRSWITTRRSAACTPSSCRRVSLATTMRRSTPRSRASAAQPGPVSLARLNGTIGTPP